MNHAPVYQESSNRHDLDMDPVGGVWGYVESHGVAHLDDGHLLLIGGAGHVDLVNQLRRTGRINLCLVADPSQLATLGSGQHRLQRKRIASQASGQ